MLSVQQGDDDAGDAFRRTDAARRARHMPHTQWRRTSTDGDIPERTGLGRGGVCVEREREQPTPTPVTPP
jgi:uncharacterized protein (UPF0254 family)